MSKMNMTDIKNTLVNGNDNLSYTENGAVGYASTLNPLVDLNFKVPSMRKGVTSAALKQFEYALASNFTYAVKWMFYLRDIRGGIGERDSFTKLYADFSRYDHEAAVKCLPLIAEYGRWKDVVSVAFASGSTVKDECIELISAQFKEDLLNYKSGKSISLLAKWLPSINASQKAREQAKYICNALGLTHQEYRKALSGLRSYLDVTEVKTCGNNWSEIDYNKVSSNANLRYSGSFLKHDEVRRKEYLAELAKPASECSVVMHAQDLTPCEIWHKYCGNQYYGNITVNDSLERMWENLKQIDCTGDTMCIVDGSGSMTAHIGTGSISALSVARSLGVYFAEHNKGEMKDKFITFSSRPQIVDLSGCTNLASKINTCFNYNDCSNTNLEAVFRLILETAVRGKMSQSDIPERLLIISDMEFDQATSLGWGEGVVAKAKTLFDHIAQEYARYGYKLPKLVFWNVNSRTNTIPVTSNEAGVILVSGYSVNLLNMVMSGQADPWLALKETLDGERYSAIDKALA